MDKYRFKKEAQEKMEALFVKIEKLQEKLEPLTEEAKREVKIAGEKSLLELQDLKVSLQKQVDEMHLVAEKKWGLALKEFDKVSDEIIDKANEKINKLWDKMKGLFE